MAARRQEAVAGARRRARREPRHGGRAGARSFPRAEALAPLRGFSAAWLALLLLLPCPPTRAGSVGWIPARVGHADETSAREGGARETLARGRVVERVVCEADATQSYALFLPSTYTPDRKWPIVYALDPAARGAFPVKRFEEAAETFGYIVAGSNTSRNGPMNLSVAAFAAMWDDTRGKLSIDERRVYTTGFSGGARVACWIAASLKGAIAGVVACGAGFPTQLRPERPISFALFGAVGDDDYNNAEVRRLGEALAGIGAAVRVETFEGAHEWAPARVCVEALEWLQLQAMKSGALTRDAGRIERFVRRQASSARAREEAGSVLEALRAYEALARDLEGLADAAEFESAAARLRASAQVRAALKRERDDDARQRRLTGEFLASLELFADQSARAVARADMRRMIADLRGKAGGAAGSPGRAYARRALGDARAALSQSASAARDAGRYVVAATLFEIAAEIRPGDSATSYEVARLYARGGDKKRALEVLRRAVEEGFADAARLAADGDFAPLRGEAAYGTILERLAAPKR